MCNRNVPLALETSSNNLGSSHNTWGYHVDGWGYELNAICMLDLIHRLDFSLFSGKGRCVYLPQCHDGIVYG